MSAFVVGGGVEVKYVGKWVWNPGTQMNPPSWCWLSRRLKRPWMEVPFDGMGWLFSLMNSERRV